MPRTERGERTTVSPSCSAAAPEVLPRRRPARGASASAASLRSTARAKRHRRRGWGQGAGRPAERREAVAHLTPLRAAAVSGCSCPLSRPGCCRPSPAGPGRSPRPGLGPCPCPFAPAARCRPAGAGGLSTAVRRPFAVSGRQRPAEGSVPLRLAAATEREARPPRPAASPAGFGAWFETPLISQTSGSGWGFRVERWPPDVGRAVQVVFKLVLSSAMNHLLEKK